jgi:hypothetical protein
MNARAGSLKPITDLMALHHWTNHFSRHREIAGLPHGLKNNRSVTREAVIHWFPGSDVG